MSGATRLTRRPLREDGLAGTLFYPAGSGPRPAVVVLGGSDGGVMEGTAARLAREGYAALALGYFGAGALPPELIEVPVEYFGRAISWLKTQPAVDGDRLAVMGSSKGGELALLLAAYHPDDIGAVVGYGASPVVWQGIPALPPALACPRSSWSYSGRPLPFVSFAWPVFSDLFELRSAGLPFWPFFAAYPELRYPFAWTPIFERSLKDRRAVAAATIPLEQINGPVLLVSGTDDRLWPATRLAEMALERLRALRSPHPHAHLRYEGAGHLTGLPYSISPLFQDGPLEMGGTPETNDHMCRDSWPKALDFLGTHLKA